MLDNSVSAIRIVESLLSRKSTELLNVFFPTKDVEKQRDLIPGASSNLRFWHLQSEESRHLGIMMRRNFNSTKVY